MKVASRQSDCGPGPLLPPVKGGWKMRADQVVDRSQQGRCRHRSVEYEIGPMPGGGDVFGVAVSAAEQVVTQGDQWVLVLDFDLAHQFAGQADVIGGVDVDPPGGMGHDLGQGGEGEQALHHHDAVLSVGGRCLECGSRGVLVDGARMVPIQRFGTRGAQSADAAVGLVRGDVEVVQVDESHGPGPVQCQRLREGRLARGGAASDRQHGHSVPDARSTRVQPRHLHLRE